MSKTFQHTIWVSVLLASGVLVTGCRSEKKTSSVNPAEETAPSKAERAHAPGAKSSALLKSTAHPKLQAQADTKTASASSAKPGDSKKESFSNYGEGAAGAGITDPTDTENTVSGRTASPGK